MGLDASVMCRCYFDGLTVQLPCPDHVKLSTDFWLELDLPYREHPEKHDEFIEWLSSACEHHGMEAASEHISNWSGLYSFKQALEDIGWEYFPVIQAELPDGNGGHTSSETAATMLEELKFFQKHAILGSDLFLVNTETGDEFHTYIEAYGGVMILDGRTGVTIGFDDAGFYSRVTEKGRSVEKFRSLRIEQRLLEPEKTGSSRKCVPYIRGEEDHGISAA